MLDDGVSLLNALRETMNQAFEANDRSVQESYDAAKAETEYRIAKKKLETVLRAKKYPISLINDFAKGDESVCEKFINMQKAYAKRDATKEEINLLKRQADILREEIKREYGVNQ